MYVICESGMESIKIACNQAEGITYTASRDYIRLRRLHTKPFGLNKQPKLTVQLRLFLVEVVGVEPTSYSAAKKLSTYLFYLLFLNLQTRVNTLL